MTELDGWETYHFICYEIQSGVVSVKANAVVKANTVLEIMQVLNQKFDTPVLIFFEEVCCNDAQELVDEECGYMEYEDDDEE